MRLPAGVTLGLAIGAVALAGGWAKSCLDAAEARGRVAAMVQDVARFGQAFDDSLAVLASRDSVRTRAMDSLAVIEADARAANLRLRRQVNRPRIDSVLVSVPETVQVLIREALDTLQAAEVACRSALAACDSSRSVAVLGWRESTVLLERADSLAGWQASVIGELERTQRGGFTVGSIVPWAVAAGLLAVLVVK